jgi:hypothetical protein
VFVLVFVGIVAVVALIGYLSWQAKQKRREALHTFAARNNLEFSSSDPFRLDRSYDFHLFDMGDGRGCENVMSGEWQGLKITEADYWYYTESTDSEGRRSRSYSHFSVLLIALDAWLPGVRLERENPLTRLADHVGLSDIEFESEDFNRRFNVKAKDKEFAFKLVDARMMQWLLAAPHKVCLEANGGHVLLWCKRLGSAEVGELFMMGKAFVEHVPRLVWNEYGKAAS